MNTAPPACCRRHAGETPQCPRRSRSPTRIRAARPRSEEDGAEPREQPTPPHCDAGVTMPRRDSRRSRAWLSPLGARSAPARGLPSRHLQGAGLRCRPPAVQRAAPAFPGRSLRFRVFPGGGLGELYGQPFEHRPAPIVDAAARGRPRIVAGMQLRYHGLEVASVLFIHLAVHEASPEVAADRGRLGRAFLRAA